MALVKVTSLGKDYEMGSEKVVALSEVEFEIEAGSFVVIMGPSGSGKSTLLHMLGGLDTPSSGSVIIDGQDLAMLPDDDLTAFRRRKLGFVFQFFNLMPTMRAWENVALPMMLDGHRLTAKRSEAVQLLERVGLGHRTDHRPGQLSGGEMQRVAIARALAMDPLLILADEPTGNLDSRAGGAVLELLRRFADDEGKTVVMVTHERRAAEIGDRVIHLEDGRVV